MSTPSPLAYLGPLRGVDHPGAKLTEDQVRQIRALHSRGYGYRRLSQAFRMSQSSIRNIVMRRTWAHVS